MSKNRKVLFLSGVLLIALGIGYLSYWLVSGIRAKQNEEVLHSVAFRETTAPVTEAPTTVPVTMTIEVTETETVVTTTKEPYVSPIDFEALWEINPDIYAWIELVDTDISYPLLQHPTDNDYYLFHTPEGYSGFPGSIYTFNVNAKDFSDFNTVIYGHRMNDGTMFSNLYMYRDEAYLKEHQTIKIYLPDRELIYTIFASVVYDDRLITADFDFADPDSCRAYLKSIYENRDMNSHILEEPKATEHDHIITLSTCIKGQESNRYLVVAVLTDEIN
ncbi:MAG: class B sortase [Oscillospiraceae bacterium]|nr:class B sortase [Oscillospiraceae bacterium]